MSRMRFLFQPWRGMGPELLKAKGEIGEMSEKSVSS